MNAPAEALVTLADFDRPDALILGIGNDGRQDDGLGWAFIDWLEQNGLCPQAELQRNYQLQIEDAELISRKQRVLFVDATLEPEVESFVLRPGQPQFDYSFTSHEVSIASILATCKTCFGRLPEVHVLAIRGYEWELQMGLSERAQVNLQAAQKQLLPSRATEPA
ncbi:MAG: hydrogenase maturation protease [Serpentinimonas sp.]|nr:MAG: Ni/Fe hydrogenase [Comamonadaceae bacterium BICA1-1]MDO8274329.1 hydrogenase maturation protease [Serpentinimonas sp.]MDO9612739.1 hydrogenase maturation protease [Serpentinimonas sp.]